MVPNQLDSPAADLRVLSLKLLLKPVACATMMGYCAIAAMCDICCSFLKVHSLAAPLALSMALVPVLMAMVAVRHGQWH